MEKFLGTYITDWAIMNQDDKLVKTMLRMRVGDKYQCNQAGAYHLVGIIHNRPPYKDDSLAFTTGILSIERVGAFTYRFRTHNSVYSAMVVSNSLSLMPWDLTPELSDIRLVSAFDDQEDAKKNIEMFQQWLNDVDLFEQDDDWHSKNCVLALLHFGHSGRFCACENKTIAWALRHKQHINNTHKIVNVYYLAFASKRFFWFVDECGKTFLFNPNSIHF